ncbi:MAG: response regulator [Nitrospirae bacterium]|nr:response regulator [Candidatus Manganitrophaceae bacterium]
MPLKTLRILLVEDNPHDIEIARRAFSKSNAELTLVVVSYGQDALDYLNHRGKFHPPDISPRPSLILLDLNLPRMNGLEVLKKIKNTPHLQSIPVIILTASERNEDIAPSYALGANTYIQKPIKFSDFLDIAKGIQKYWADVASLPEQNA